MTETYENSVRDFVERIKAGAVIVDRSPLKDAMDYRVSVKCHVRVEPP